MRCRRCFYFRQEIGSLGGACCGPADVEAYCRRSDVEEFASIGLEVRCTSVASKSSGALEACCMCRDVEEFASRGLEMRCRRRDIELWSAYCLLLLKFLAFVPQGLRFVTLFSVGADGTIRNPRLRLAG